ncbi:retron St85 family effector protein [Aeromonas media]|uniref:retron St85 family effector protein n=1 Tax=Aeromonas media TaxID=651 RepID=UPI000FBE1FEB
MYRKLASEQLKVVSKIIKDFIFIPLNSKKVTVFLCGADINDSSTARAKMAAIFSTVPRYDLIYPEDIFDDLLAGQGQYSLLTLENILAESVDAIVLFPESPGSLTELGAFSNNAQLAAKTIVLSDKKFEKKKSFINYGPYRLIKESGTGKVFHIKYDDLNHDTEKTAIYKKVNDQITRIRSSHVVLKNEANILEVESFILPCIYLIENIDKVMLLELLKHATMQKEELCDIAIKSALSRLTHKNFISRSDGLLSVTNDGINFVRDKFSNIYLDKARVEILNVENRRNSTVCYDRVNT